MRIRSLLAGVVMTMVLLVPVTAAGAVAGFGDIEEGAFYTDAVQWMVDNEITTGTSPTCFSPDDTVTRGQAAAFMWRMEGRSAPAGAHGFADVFEPWQQDPVAWMVEQIPPITLGTTATTFEPGLPLNRGQLATFLWRLEGEPTGAPPTLFTDVPAGAFFEEAVRWMVAQVPPITLGTTATTFSPYDTVTRGQVATFFHRYKGEPSVTLDPSSPPCPDFFGPIEPTPDISGSAGFQLAPGGGSITGFVVNLDIDDYRCPGISVTVTSDGTFQVSPAQPVGIFGGSFTYVSFSQDWTGTITGDSASGTVEGAFMAGSGDSCEWGPLNWTATRS
jgi:hypothetical protein